MNVTLDLRQRAEFTHKANLRSGRHGWLRLTPAYGVTVVEKIIGSFPDPVVILDPFCGTGTTALSAAYHGHTGITTDINPFLVWLGRAKVSHYSLNVLNETLDACKRALGLVHERTIKSFDAPPIHNIQRWWSASALDFLCALRAAIDSVAPQGGQVSTLLSIAFCRTLITISNASFNHQSMSFKESEQTTLGFVQDYETIFSTDVRFVLDGAGDNTKGKSEVILADARDVGRVISAKVDCVITSPPYANRMSYIRELRPYMYWLGFLKSGKEAGELDWMAIGGTWGVATSRLSEWSPKSEVFSSKLLANAVAEIARSDNKNGVLLSRYVAKYFDDMWLHFEGLAGCLANGAQIHYIVGNSTFYGTLLSVERIYAEMLSALGFTGVATEPIRKRNSKKELVEFDVAATWR